MSFGPAAAASCSSLPRSLQPRAPARYALLDASGRRVPPTLAGYRLKPGTEYTLRVETQHGRPNGWSLHLAAPGEFIDWHDTDSPSQHGRTLRFRTRRRFFGGWYEALATPANQELSFMLHFDDGGQHELRVPVVLSFRWLWLACFLLLATAGLAFYPQWIQLEQRIALAVGVPAILAGVCCAYDFWRTCRLAATRSKNAFNWSAR